VDQGSTKGNKLYLDKEGRKEVRKGGGRRKEGRE
jgi:hypothetical protein